MLSLRALMVTLAFATTNVLGQLVNPISRPTVGDILVAGTSFDILWTVTTPNELVSLILRKGPGSNIGVVGPIADSIQNTGEFPWNIPTDLPSGTDYAVEIIVGPASNVANVGPDGYNFTPQLTLVNNSTGPINSNTTITTSAASTKASNSTVVTKSTAKSETATGTEGPTTEETATATSESTGPSQTASATRGTTASGANAIIGGHGFVALIVALAVGIVASF